MTDYFDPLDWMPDRGGPSMGSELLARAKAILDQRHINPHAYEQALPLLQLSSNYALDQRESTHRADWLALCYAALGDHKEAVVYLSEAIDYARKRDVVSIRHQLLARRATSYHWLLQIGAGCRDLECILDEQRIEGATRIHTDIVIELKCRLRLATLHFFLGEFRLVTFHLNRALQLLQQTSTCQAEEAALASLWANFYFWREQPASALDWALRAVKLFGMIGQHDSEGRTQILVGETLLAIAERNPEGTRRDLDIGDAGRRITSAIKLAKTSRDATMADMGIIAQARQNLVSGHPAMAIKGVEGILDRATDPLILAQAWTALGECHIKDGEVERAVTAFRSALIVLQHTEMPSHGDRARQALMKCSESSVN